MYSRDRMFAIWSFWVQLRDVFCLDLSVQFPQVGITSGGPYGRHATEWLVAGVSQKFWKNTISKMLPKGIINKRKVRHSVGENALRFPVSMSWTEFRMLQTQHWSSAPAETFFKDEEVYYQHGKSVYLSGIRV